MNAVSLFLWASSGDAPKVKEVGDNIYVWLAVVLASFAILKQIYDTLKNRQKTRDEVEEALDRQPFIREQLELGNFGEAIRQLNIIINSQAEHITRQDKRIEHLEERNAALESEAQGWERRAGELEAQVDSLEADVIRLTRQLDERPHNPHQ